MGLRGVCAAAAAVAVWTGFVRADLVQITFTGTVSEVFDTRNLPLPLQQLMVGDSFTYTVVMDTSAGTAVPDAGYLEEYDGFQQSQLTLGGASSAPSTTAFEYFAVGDDQEGEDFLDTAASNGGSSFFGFNDRFAVTASFADTSVLSAPSIPTSLDVTLGVDDFSQFSYNAAAFDGGPLGSMDGVVTRVTAQVIPAPGGAMLLGLAGIGAARRRRR